MYHFNLFFPDGQMERLRTTAEQADVAVAELIRRCVTHGLQPKVLNRLLPTCSGQIVLETGRG